MPGFPRVLEAVAEFYRDKRGEATRVGQELLERLRQGERVRAGTELLTPSVLDTAYQGLRAEFDARHGGTRAGAQVPSADGVRLPPSLLAAPGPARRRSRWCGRR